MKTLWYFGADGALISKINVDDAHPELEEHGYTDEPPPDTLANEAVVRVGGAWTVVPDYRGRLFHDPDSGEEVCITAVGEFPPAGWHEGPALRSLPGKRLAKWAEMKGARDAFEFGGFDWDGSRFDSDPSSQSRLQGGCQLATLAAMASAPFEVEWTLADNTVRTLDGPQMLAVGQALGEHILQTHVVGRQVRAQIEACTTVDEVAEVFWP